MLKRCLLSMFILVMVVVFVAPANANARSEEHIWEEKYQESVFDLCVDAAVLPWDALKNDVKFQMFTHNQQVATVIYNTGTNIKKMWGEKVESSDHMGDMISYATLALCSYTLANKMLDISYDNLKGRTDDEARELRDYLDSCDFVLNDNVHSTYERVVVKAYAGFWGVSKERARQLYNEDMQIILNAAVERLGGIENITMR